MKIYNNNNKILNNFYSNQLKKENYMIYKINLNKYNKYKENNSQILI
jgi:hypothetical protein